MIEQIIKISYPLYVLKKLLEIKLNKSLETHKFYLRLDNELLDDTTIHADDSMKNEIAKFQVEINESQPDSPKIHIIDIQKAKNVRVLTDYLANESDDVYLLNQFFVSDSFNKLKKDLKITKDVKKWNNDQVKIWFKWSCKEFELDLNNINIDNIPNMNGRLLYSLKKSDIEKFIPNAEKLNIFLAHLSILTKFHVCTSFENKSLVSRLVHQKQLEEQKSDKSEEHHENKITQIQLWQFLLEMLLDKNNSEYIRWCDSQGEFELLQPNEVARLWGLKKGFPNMTYSSLSRSLRSYYSTGILDKVNKPRYVYKFLIDFKAALGYSFEELNMILS